MHHIVHHRRPEGGRGEGDDNGAEGTIVPQPADPPERLQGFRGQCQTGPREFGSSDTRGDDDETPRWLGGCNGWVLLWPKSLLHLEAAGSTPTSTQPQQGMNINTPPTQLASGVGLGDSGRGEEEAPLVAGDVAIDEDEDDTQQYVNTGAYLGFERHESVLELPPPESERIMDNQYVHPLAIQAPPYHAQTLSTHIAEPSILHRHRRQY